jgi:hypothetical protein
MCFVLQEGDADENEDLYVLIEAPTDAQLESAAELIRDLLYNPEAAARIREEQMKQVMPCACCVLVLPMWFYATFPCDR